VDGLISGDNLVEYVYVRSDCTKPISAYNVKTLGTEDSCAE
jgi:hypothetical protein